MSVPVTISYYEKLRVDGSLKAQVFDFVQKLMQDPTNPSLNIKTIHNAVDKRVRTGRVNKQFRAVLFELQSANSHHFVLVDVDSHDEGIEKARRFDPARLRLDVNPVNGLTSLIEETAPAEYKPEVDYPDIHVSEPVDATPSTPKPREVLDEAGYTPESLYNELGIDPQLMERVFNLTSEDDLDGLLEGRPAWEAEAVTGLLAGFTVEEVREQLGIRTQPPTSELDEEAGDSRAIAGLKHPAAAMEFAYIGDGDTEALRKVIETGDFDKWRVFIHPEQRRMAEGKYKGSARVFGGAGTGKTVVALHRANNLIKRNPKARILLTTYTRDLSEGLKSQMATLNPDYPESPRLGAAGLRVENIDAVVYKVVNNATTEEIANASQAVLGSTSTGKQTYSDTRAKQVWEEVLLGADVDLPASVANATFLQQEYETVVLANAINNQSAYLRVSRSGRGTALNRSQRKKVWTLLESVMQTQAIDGRYFWPTISALGAEILKRRGPLFDHIVVDEAQDFNAGHWRFLRAAVAPGADDIFLAEDSHQRIYGQSLVLSRFGISTRGRASRRLTLNYRTTKENLEYALRILAGDEHGFTDSQGEEDTTRGYRSVRTGPQPIVKQCTSIVDELDTAVEHIDRWLEKDPNAHIGVMCRTRGRIAQIVSGLAERGINAVQNAQAAAKPTASSEEGAVVSVMTMHGAKGLEFTHVVLMGVSDDALPLRYTLHNLGSAELEDAIQRERSLLYVAASRARDELLITTAGKPSELLPEE